MAGLMDTVDGVSKLRDHLASERRAKLATNWAAYADVLRSLALGEDVDAAEMAIVLSMVDKTPDDLSEDLEKFKRRLEWRAQLDTLPGLQRDLAKAAAEHESLKAEWARVVPALNQKIEAAHVARQAIENAIDAARMSEGWLSAQPLNTALIEQERRLSERLSVLMDERRDWQAKVAAEVKNAEYAADCARRQPEHATYHNELQEVYRKRAKAFDPHLERVEQSIAEVQSELGKIRAAKLQP